MLNTASFSETKSTRQIQTLFWPRSASLITHRRKSCTITLDEVKDVIDKKYENADRMIKTITVRLIDLDWFMKHEMKFLKLTQLLNEAENQSIFVTEFVMQVLNEFWEENFLKLLWRQFFPFIGCLLSLIFYLQYALVKDETLEQLDEKLI